MYVEPRSSFFFVGPTVLSTLLYSTLLYYTDLLHSTVLSTASTDLTGFWHLLFIVVGCVCAIISLQVRAIRYDMKLFFYVVHARTAATTATINGRQYIVRRVCGG